ncbi:MAG: type II toxin-antitoxin system PemK/MazF family toxin, partial [Sarcina sp.]|nr:type II toxin-antitoxin system PemK/MazF family toxin [Sarcina sp.]
SPTIIIAILTSQIKKERMDPHVILPKVKGLWKSSMVCAEQRRTIDKSRLIRYCCTLDESTMKEITRACHKAEAPDEQKKRFW